MSVYILYTYTVNFRERLVKVFDGKEGVKPNNAQEEQAILVSGGFSRQVIQQVLDVTDIVELVGDYLPLKVIGHEGKACCPFHKERSPSFTVNSDKQFYHCFGCGEHGDAIAFLMAHQNYEFMESVEYLAERASISVNYEKRIIPNYKKSISFVKEKIEQIVESEKEIFEALLYQRKIPGDLAKSLLISTAKEGDSLEGFLPEVKSDSLLFPVLDRRKRVIGFATESIESGETNIYPDSAIYGVSTIGVNKHLFVTGSPSHSVRLSQAVDCVSYASHVPSQEQIKGMLKLNANIVFCFHIGAVGYKSAWETVKALLPHVTGKNHIRFLFHTDDIAGSLIDFGEDPDHAINYSDFLIERIIELISNELEANPNIQRTEHYLFDRLSSFCSLMPQTQYREMFSETCKDEVLSHFMALPKLTAH